MNTEKLKEAVERLSHKAMGDEDIKLISEVATDVLEGRLDKPASITYDKSVLKFMCETFKVPYNENIVGFTKYGVIIKPEALSSKIPQCEVSICEHDWQPEWYPTTEVTSLSNQKKWRCLKCLAVQVTYD